MFFIRAGITCCQLHVSHARPSAIGKALLPMSYLLAGTQVCEHNTQVILSEILDFLASDFFMVFILPPPGCILPRVFSNVFQKSQIGLSIFKSHEFPSPLINKPNGELIHYFTLGVPGWLHTIYSGMGGVWAPPSVCGLCDGSGGFRGL